ncbi:relaxase domain-containing protein [Sandaracinobacter sp. RS1-74]|uniref:MobF family relaxase n=1 Tax=Sandaracinobacteroides sayramensis TaxID=2913411 RepID=UPI001EDBE29E|nr:MobF family relaxase [Sandaracinobacteroides sayramensis]MCG2841286.1 relaxase domain-containing protein [Sandaracinobacteroides sayramensis]
MIHPRRLKGTPANLARYYTIGDYYTKGGDEHSEWGGRLAPDLGLEGKVDPAVFQEMLSGKVEGFQLGRHGKDGQLQHHPGWDFAVNAPKSVSIMALVHGDERIIAAHEYAVGAAIDYIEEHAQLRRRFDGEIVHVTTGRLLFARFTEHSSRELDPHLHTHVVVMNMTNEFRGDNVVSLETRAMFAEQMVGGQVYRNALAHRLREIGYEIEFDPKSGLFEIKGIPEDMLRDMSQRAEQIDAHAKEHGHVGQAQRAKSFYATRRAKESVGLDELHARWADRAKPWEPALQEIANEVARKGEQTLEPDRRVAAQAAAFGVRQAETHEAVNNMGRFYRIALASHVGEVRLEDVRPLLEAQEATSKLFRTIQQSGDRTQMRGRTSLRTVRLELALSEHLSLAMGDAAPLATRERLMEAAQSARLTDAQTAALFNIASGTDRLVGIQGVGGSGKSTLVGALVNATRPDFELVALAPTSSAAADLGAKAGIESRTVASLLAKGGHDVTEKHILVVDEAGQLGNRQAKRLLEISRHTGAKLILIGDTKQTGAIEQGKAFWLLQQLGMPTSYLTESMRQETRAMKAAVSLARNGEYAASLAALDRVATGESAEKLAEDLVKAWTRLKPSSRAATNILVLDNATRLIVNSQIRETLKTEGALAAQDARLEVLVPAAMTEQEKHFARFYSGGQVVMFARDNAGIGIARDTEYRVTGTGRDSKGRQVVHLVDQNGRTIAWNPRLGKAGHVNVFLTEKRDLAEGDRIQWRLVNKQLGLKNAERGTVETLDGTMATIRWDRGERVETIDLSKHKTWDHGYSETVYSAQSKTYARVFVLAPVESGLVNGQNFYTAITRARLGVKLWTEDLKRLAEKLHARSGEKASTLEALGRLQADSHRVRSTRHRDRLDRSRDTNAQDREMRRQERERQERGELPDRGPRSLGEILASRAHEGAMAVDRFLRATLDRERDRAAERAGGGDHADRAEPVHQPQPDHDHGGHGGGHDR